MVRILSNYGNGSARLLNAHTIIFSAFFFAFFLAYRHIRSIAWRDPGSVFFDPVRAFAKVYSLERENQGNAYIDTIMSESKHDFVKASPDASFCVGIATVQRVGARYFKTAVGSLLDGLGEEERRDINLVSFIANVDPTVHQAYNESWMYDLSDRVITYKDIPESEAKMLIDLEQHDNSFLSKPILDYMRLLEACMATNAPYTIILEDDVLAADGWYHRTKDGVRALEQKSDGANTLYLRLFHNERLLGWNGESWPWYLLWSMWIDGLVALALWLLWKYHAPSTKFLTPRTTFLILFLCTPLCIGLYFAAGRLTVSPLPHGITRMNTFGCCSQAFLFPREQITDLIAFFKEEGSGMIDNLCEDYANANAMSRYALNPSVFQHVGTKSSKWDRPSMWNRNGAQNIWSWSFEQFDKDALHREHEMRLGQFPAR